MPTLKENKDTWGDSYDWSDCGEEWSAFFGDSETQWYGTLYPRLHNFLDCSHTKSVLEIAPGFGRWTRFLLDKCDNYTGIDLSEKCIAHCKNIFDKGEFHCNDGLSLDLIPDNSIDFCFSFDSLVHAEKSVMESYIPQIINKLTKNGVAFIHHSNFYACRFKAKTNNAWRAVDVSGEIVHQLIKDNAGKLIMQENFPWKPQHDKEDKKGPSTGDSNLREALPPLTDTMTIFTKNVEGNIYVENTKIINNYHFLETMKHCKKYLYKYSSQNLFTK